MIFKRNNSNIIIKLQVISDKGSTGDEKPLHAKMWLELSATHAELPLSQHGICVIFTMETDIILQHMHTRREQLPWHPAPWRREAFCDQTNSLSSWLDTQSKPSAYHSLIPSPLLYFPPPFFLLFYNTLHLSWPRKITFYRQRTRSCSALQERLCVGWWQRRRSSAGIPRDAAEPAPQARTHPQPQPPPARAAAAAAENRKGRGMKYKK